MDKEAVLYVEHKGTKEQYRHSILSPSPLLQPYSHFPYLYKNKFLCSAFF